MTHPTPSPITSGEALKDHTKTLRELLMCFQSWEPAVRVLGNVRADDAAEAITAALASAASAPVAQSDRDAMDAKRYRFLRDKNRQPMPYREGMLDATIDAAIAAQQPADGGELTLENAPLGTKAPAHGGGHWIKVDRGWKWFTGSTFPRPGGDWTGDLFAPAEGGEQSHG